MKKIMYLIISILVIGVLFLGYFSGVFQGKLNENFPFFIKEEKILYPKDLIVDYENYENKLVKVRGNYRDGDYYVYPDSFHGNIIDDSGYYVWLANCSEENRIIPYGSKVELTGYLKIIETCDCKSLRVINFTKDDIKELENKLSVTINLTKDRIYRIERNFPIGEEVVMLITDDDWNAFAFNGGVSLSFPTTRERKDVCERPPYILKNETFFIKIKDVGGQAEGIRFTTTSFYIDECDISSIEKTFLFVCTDRIKILQ